ncbi:MAG: MBOAT family protein [candidate division Zixibacteria bacterium]|nr:MBOAT family protein [candidate division Zixibacteria bacterium]
MLFNSYVYIFLFLPVVLAVYFLLNNRNLIFTGKVWLVLASLFFYSYWNPIYLPLILASMLVNYFIGGALSKDDYQARHWLVSRKSILVSGIVFNLSLLGYYKYADFFITNANFIFGADIHLLRLVLPLAISFFTFQQIAYLVDNYKDRSSKYDFINFALFVSFFPQLISGPIVHHKEMMPQFGTTENKSINYKNMSTGIFIFFLGLFKKVVIADTLAVAASNGFDNAAVLTFAQAWVSSLSYTCQLYFDFSGYTDMAIGTAFMFNIVLPLNFNSPYKALNIQDFWRRWHMTLSRWLRDYLYISLGGNRKGNIRTYINLFTTFLLGGLWHGAGWTFVVWGAMHGFGTTIHKFWQSYGIRLPKSVAWFITFMFVHFAWVFFRATSFKDAVKVFKGMFAFNTINSASILYELKALNFEKTIETVFSITVLIIALIVSIRFKNSNELRLNLNFRYLMCVAFLIVSGFIFLNSNISEFLYFNF